MHTTASSDNWSASINAFASSKAISSSKSAPASVKTRARVFGGGFGGLSGDVGAGGGFWGGVSAALMDVVLLVRSLSVVFRGGVGSVSTPCLLPHAPIVDEVCGGEFGWEALGGVVVGDVNECFKLCYHYFTALREHSN